MEDVERAIVASFELVAVRPGDERYAIKQQAMSFLDEIEGSQRAWKVGLELFLKSSASKETRFYGLRWLVGALERGDVAPQGRLTTRSAILNWLGENLQSLAAVPLYIRLKVSVVFAQLIKQDFPDQWPNAFGDLLAFASSTRESAMFMLKVLEYITDDVVDGMGLRNPLERESNTRVKDAMRHGPLSDITEFWYQLLTNIQGSGEELAHKALLVMRDYIGWIDVTLIVNDRFVPLFYHLLSTKEFRVDALKCFHAIVHKGMLAADKVQLIMRLELRSALIRECAADRKSMSNGTARIGSNAGHTGNSSSNVFSNGVGGEDDGGERESEYEDEEGWGFRENIALLVGEIGAQLLQARLELGPDVPQSVAALEELSLHIIPLALSECLAHPDEDAQESVIDFLNRLARVVGEHIEYEMGQFENTVATRNLIKRQALPRKPDRDLDTVCRRAVDQILPILLRQVCFPSHLDYKEIRSSDSGDEEEDFKEHRKELRNFFVNIVRQVALDNVLPFLALAVQEVFESPARMAACTPAQVEATLMLVHAFGDGAPIGVVSRPNRTVAEQARLANAMHIKELAKRKKVAKEQVDLNSTLLPNDLDKAAAEDERRAKGRAEFASIVLQVHRCNLWGHPSPRVLATYIEFTSRYVSFLAGQPQGSDFVLLVLEGLIQKGGVRHPDAFVRTLACSQLLVVVKGLGQLAAPYATAALNSLKDLLVIEYDAVVAKLVEDEPEEAAALGLDSSVSGKGPTYSVTDSINLFEVASALIQSQSQSQPAQIKENMEVAMEPVYKQLVEITKSVSSAATGSPTSRSNANSQINLLGFWAAESIHALSQMTKSVPLKKSAGGNGVAKEGHEAAGSSNNTVDPAIAHLLKVCLDSSLRALHAMPEHTVLRSRIVTMLHCTVRVLGQDSIEFGPTIGIQLLEQSASLEHVLEILTFFNQLVRNCQQNLLPSMDSLFVRILSHVEKVLHSIPDPFAEVVAAHKQRPARGNRVNGSAAEQVTEAPMSRLQAMKAEALRAAGRGGMNGAGLGSLSSEQEEYRRVKRSLALMLQDMAACGLDQTFYSPTNVVHLDNLFEMLIGTLARFPDPSCQKTCVNFFILLCEKWLEASNAGAPDANIRNSFVRVLFERVSVASFQAVNTPSFDVRIQDSSKLLERICFMHKKFAALFGQQWLQHLRDTTLPSVSCPPQLAAEYTNAVANTDLAPKQLRDHFKRVFLG